MKNEGTIHKINQKSKTFETQNSNFFLFVRSSIRSTNDKTYNVTTYENTF